MNGFAAAPVSAFSMGVAAADHLRTAYRQDRKAKGLQRGSLERARAEILRDHAIDAACAAEEAVLQMQPAGPDDLAAMAVAGFQVLSRLTENDTFDANTEAGRQAAAVKRSLANMVARVDTDRMFQLCGPTTYSLLLNVANDTQFSENGPLLLRA